MSRSWKGHFATAGNRFLVRTTADLTTDQKEKEQAEHEVKAGEAKQREKGGAIAHHFAVAVARAKEAVDQPRLASQFGCHPAQGVGDVRKGECQHEHPEKRGAGFESTAPVLKTGISHKHYE